MKRLTAAILALTLAGCALPENHDILVDAVIEEPVAIEPAPTAHAKIEECAPGEDDGIGGTGCSID